MPFSKKALAANMRVRRAELDISQSELARRCGLTVGLIWNYENERITPGADKASSIAEALGVTLDELCSPKENSGQ